MQTEVYVYAIDPIDNWAGWYPAGAVLGDDTIVIDDKLNRAEFTNFAAIAMGLARDIGWEGDIRGTDLYVAGMPITNSGGCDSYVVGWKQDNNGCTFIASPVPLPHLENGGNRAMGKVYGTAYQAVLRKVLLEQQAAAEAESVREPSP